MPPKQAVPPPEPKPVAPAAPRPPRAQGRRSPRQILLAAAGVVACAVLAYSNATPPVAIHDDTFFVPARHDLSTASIVQIFSEDTWSATGQPQGTYRPLAILSIAVNGAMFGNRPAGYHATNVVLHATASLFVFLLLVELLGSGQWLAAALAAGVFAVHPVHTEAVDSIFNRSEVMATISVVASLWVIARWHETRTVMAWTVAAVVYLAGMLSRESAVTLPALAAAMLWFMHPDEAPREKLRRILPAAFLAIPLFEYFVLRQHGLAATNQAVAPVLGTVTDTDIGSRFLYSVATLREYVRMLVWPRPLRLSYENFTADGLVLAALVHAALVAGAFALRRKAPIGSFAIAFFYIAFLPSTRVFTSIGDILSATGSTLARLSNTLLIAERVAYLPSVSVAIGLGALLAALARRSGVQVAAVCAAVPLLAGFAVTYDRNRDWHSAESLFSAEVAAAPDNGDAWRLYISAITSAGRYEEAAKACDAQLDQPGRSAQLFNNCGVVYDKLQRDEHAMRAYQGAIDQGLVTVGHANLGRVYARMGRMVEAEAEFVAAAESENDPARRHYRNGLTLARFHTDKAAEARAEFEAALALQPDFAAAREALSRLPR